ncbi:MULTISPECIES: ATP-binding protein [unclassified Brevundimonas]|uniref:ATP-binding protein n=1 Tax=unclassified Brevundimonas TaxID=2622653 RepID=UPI0025BC32CF|nr:MULTISPECIES: ATP-binding protein [unclassified Brevundimonas]
MVGGSSIGRGLDGDVPGSAAQALSAILETQYLRYLIILSWGLALCSAVGLKLGLGWLVVTLAAGAVRGLAERRASRREQSDWGTVFPLVATATTAVWAIAPLLAWFSGRSFGHEMAMALLASGYVLVFAQLRNSPRQAVLISSPYGVAAVIIASSLWGTPDFWSFLTTGPLMLGGLFVLVLMTMLREERILAFQEHQTHLISELEAARDKADAANTAKSNFLGVISHELRTPMNGVLGAAQLLSASRLDAQQREMLSIIRNSGDSLLSLLNDILDLTKIEAGKMAFEVVDIDLDALHRRLLSPFEAQAKAKGLKIQPVFTGEVPSIVRGDPLRVSQILSNLLSNAVKFTDKGEIRYGVHGRRISDNRVAFEFSVQDTGGGISESDLCRLFQPFTQIDNSSTRKYGGTGLGLTISRRLANIMHGDIHVESQLGVGSTFTFSVEAEVVAWDDSKLEEADASTQGDIQGMKVLVVEDHPVNRMILEAWMGSNGHLAATAEHGGMAVELAANQAFDLIVMDVNMPVMDGLEATRQIRSESPLNADTPIIVLSASARAEDHQAGFSAGADAYLNKPIDFRQLATFMVQASEGREALRGLSASTEVAHFAA